MNPPPEDFPACRLAARGRSISFPRRPLIMGILNINDDSFSGDGRLDSRWALDRAAELAGLGADIIDVGAESARTNRAAISEDAEIARLEPFLRGFARAVAAARPRDPEQIFPPLLSVNTWRPRVAGHALGIAGDILNDMGALPNDDNARHCARTGAALLIMHSVGAPKEKHTHTRYDNIIASLESFFREKLEAAARAGVAHDATILDPGIDFAKQAPDNLRILHETARLAALRRPVLLPVSRKSVIGKTLGIEDARERDAGTAACLVAGMLRGAAIFRVHDVDMAWRTVLTIGRVTGMVPAP
jgi:dihydropteroate synthase